MRAQPRRGKGFVDVRAAFVAQREAAEAMQPGQGAFDNPAEDAEAAAMRTAGLGHHRHDALHGAGLTAQAPGSAAARLTSRISPKPKRPALVATSSSG